MSQLARLYEFLRKQLPIVIRYSNAIIHFIDMLDGKQDWEQKNPPQNL